MNTTALHELLIWKKSVLARISEVKETLRLLALSREGWDSISILKIKCAQLHLHNELSIIEQEISRNTHNIDISELTQLING